MGKLMAFLKDKKHVLFFIQFSICVVQFFLKKSYILGIYIFSMIVTLLHKRRNIIFFSGILVSGVFLGRFLLEKMYFNNVSSEKTKNLDDENKNKIDIILDRSILTIPDDSNVLVNIDTKTKNEEDIDSLSTDNSIHNRQNTDKQPKEINLWVEPQTVSSRDKKNSENLNENFDSFKDITPKEYNQNTISSKPISKREIHIENRGEVPNISIIINSKEENKAENVVSEETRRRKMFNENKTSSQNSNECINSNLAYGTSHVNNQFIDDKLIDRTDYAEIDPSGSHKRPITYVNNNYHYHMDSVSKDLVGKNESYNSETSFRNNNLKKMNTNNAIVQNKNEENEASYKINEKDFIKNNGLERNLGTENTGSEIIIKTSVYPQNDYDENEIESMNRNELGSYQKTKTSKEYSNNNNFSISQPENSFVKQSNTNTPQKKKSETNLSDNGLQKTYNDSDNNNVLSKNIEIEKIGKFYIIQLKLKRSLIIKFEESLEHYFREPSIKKYDAFTDKICKLFRENYNNLDIKDFSGLIDKVQNLSSTKFKLVLRINHLLFSSLGEFNILPNLHLLEDNENKHIYKINELYKIKKNFNANDVGEVVIEKTCQEIKDTEAFFIFFLCEISK